MNQNDWLDRNKVKVLTISITSSLLVPSIDCLNGHCSVHYDLPAEQQRSVEIRYTTTTSTVTVFGTSISSTTTI